MNIEQAKEAAKNRESLPTRKDFENRPGYEQRPAKVWRTGVGWVDGFKWRYSFQPNRDGKMTKEAGEVGEMIAPHARAEAERHMNESGVEIHQNKPTFAVMLGRDPMAEYCEICGHSPHWCECNERGD